ncbi:MAG: acyl-CoA dehydrogenase family protein [Hyphomonas sp.]
MVVRGARQAFGRDLIKLGGNIEKVSRARIEIEAMRMMVLRLQAMDVLGNKEARVWISMVKAMVPGRVCAIIDDAIQLHGATGVSRVDTARPHVCEPAHPASRRRSGRSATWSSAAPRPVNTPAKRKIRRWLLSGVNNRLRTKQAHGPAKGPCWRGRTHALSPSASYPTAESRRAPISEDPQRASCSAEDTADAVLC